MKRANQEEEEWNQEIRETLAKRGMNWHDVREMTRIGWKQKEIVKGG